MECYEQHSQKQSLHNQSFTFQNDHERQQTIEKAFDYRGDVTLTLTDGQSIEAYIFNRNRAANPPYVDLLINGENTPRRIPYPQIQAIAFTGKDTADGKSYEAWKAKKLAERKAEAQKIENEMREQGLL
jgi:hypothetical protein